MTNSSPAPLRRVSGWRLNTLIIIGTVLLTNVVVAFVDWLLLGRTSADSMKVSTVSGLIIATLVVSVAGALRARIAVQNQVLLKQGIEHAQSNLALAIETAQMIFWEFDLVNGQFHYDKSHRAWLGLPMNVPADTVQDWLALIHPEDQAPFMQQFQAALAPGAPDFYFDYRMLQAAGGWGWVHSQGRIKERNPQGQALLAVGGTFDVNQRKQAEMALTGLNTRLAESNQFQTALLEAIPIPIFYQDEQGRLLGANSAYDSFMGLPRNALVGKTVFDVAPAEQAAIYWAQSLEVMADRKTLVYETRIEDGTGQLRDVVFLKAVFTDANNQVRGIIGSLQDVTERKQSERELIESEQRTQALYTLMRMVADNVPDLIWAKDADKRFLFTNKAACEKLLMATDTDEPLGKDDLFFAQRERNRCPENPQWHTFGELCQDSDAVTLQRGCASQFEEFGNVQGKPLFLDVRKAPLMGENGELVGVVGCARDVTGEHEAQEKLRVAAAVLANSSEALILSEASTNFIVDTNPAFTKITGYTLDEVVGKTPTFLHSSKQGDSFYKAMWTHITATGNWQGEVWSQHKNGSLVALWLTVNTLYHADGRAHRLVGMFSDITDKKRSEDLIWTQANFDHLTGLPNRRMFLDRLAQDLKKAQRGGLKLALMFLDLDRFKEINDTLGHGMGDLLLKEAAQRIAACARASDTVARIGGDEFTVILTEVADISGIDRIASNILSAMSVPFSLGHEQVYVSVSIGITLYPGDAMTQDNLLKNADQAMYVSKDSGRNRFSYFTRAMQDAALHRQHLLNDLRGALARQEFELHFQPIVDLRSGQVHKAEALLRWSHPMRGQIGPAEFIALTEETGLIHGLGRWVFAQAAMQAKRWRTALNPAFQISVNLSPLQIQPGLDRLPWQQLLQDAGLAPQAVVLEITEGLLLDKSTAVAAELLAYRDAGVQVAIDDFGTGYSALAYLKQLHIDYLKIDKSFVDNLPTDASDRALCEAIVVMAHKLGLQVVAEGVETTAQLDLLKAMDCDYAQGYLFAKALPADTFEQWFAAQP